MADEGERRTARGQMALQPFDGDEVEVVGRLVQQEDVGFGAQRPRERRAPCLAPREMDGIGLGVEPEIAHHRPGRVGVVVLPEAREHVVEHRSKARHGGFLRQEGETRGRLLKARSPVWIGLAGRKPQQRRLARSVAADQRDPVTRRNREFGALEQRRAAERHGDVLEMQKGGRHAAALVSKPRGIAAVGRKGKRGPRRRVSRAGSRGRCRSDPRSEAPARGRRPRTRPASASARAASSPPRRSAPGRSNARRAR